MRKTEYLTSEAYNIGYNDGAEWQHVKDIARLKEVLNVMMIDTHDKAEIIKAMKSK